MPELAQRAALALEVARAQVVEYERTLAQMAGGQGLLNACLPGQQPVHGSVKLVFVRVLGHGALLGQGGIERAVTQGARGCQLGAREENAGGDHRHAQGTLGAVFGAQQAGHVQLLHGAQDGGDMAVGKRADDLEGAGPSRSGQFGVLAPELKQRAESFEKVVGPLGKVRQGAVADFSGVAKGLPQEDAGRGKAVGDLFDKHGY